MKYKSNRIYDYSHILNRTLMIFVNICWFWIWRQRHVSDKRLGKMWNTLKAAVLSCSSERNWMPKKNLFRDGRVKHSNKGNKDTEVSNLRGNSQTLLFYLLTSSISSKFSSWSWGYLASVLKDIPIFLQIAPTSGLTNVCRKDILSFKTDCRLL